MARRFSLLFLILSLPPLAVAIDPSAPAISVPADLTQYLVKENGELLAVPTSAPVVTGSVVVVVEEPKQVAHIEEYRKVRAAYGGNYPYLVVKSRAPYLVVSQDDDILVVGTPDPKRVIVSSDSWLRLDRQKKGGLVGKRFGPTPVDVTYVKGRPDVALALPPGVPDDLLTKRDLSGPGSDREATFEVNRKRAFRLSGQKMYGDLRDSGGTRYEVYRVILK